MSTQQIFVIWTHPLFHESVRRLLDHPEVTLVGAASDFHVAHNQILSLHPNTIIVEAVSSEIPNEVVKVLEACPWRLRVFLLSLENNQLNLYQHEQRTVRKSEDLLYLVLSE